MMLNAPLGLFTETVTRLAQNSLQTDTIIEGCSVQAGVSTEPDEQGRNAVVTSVVVFVPADAAEKLTAYDVLRIRGLDYRVEGQPVVETSVFTGMRAMVPVNVERTTG